MVDQQQQSEAGYERLGGKKLGLVDVVAQSVGFMGPVFSAAFIIPLIIGVNAAGSGRRDSAPLAVLLAGDRGVRARAGSSRNTRSGSTPPGALYDYVSNGLGSVVGTASGYLYYAGTIILTTGLGVLIGGYVHDNLMPVVFSVEDGLFPIWVWDLIFALGLFVVLYFGVQISTRVQLTLALVSVAVVLTFFLSIIVRLGGDNDFGKAFDPNPSPDGFSGIMFGVLYGVLIFVGFETAANLAEETAEPKQSIPRAVLLSVVVVAIFYIIAAYVEVAGFGFDMSVITSPDVAGAPLFALGAPGGQFGSDFILKLLLVVVFLDMLAVYVGAAVASTRGVFAMARDRRLPKMMAGVSAKYGTPTGAIAFLMGVQLGLIAASEWWDGLFALEGLPHYFSLFVWCSTFGGFALLVVYFLMSIGALAGIATDPEKVKLVIAAILGLADQRGGDLRLVLQGARRRRSWLRCTRSVLFVVGLIVAVLVKGRAPASGVLADLSSGGDA